MGLLGILRSGVKTIDSVTKDLQSTVTYKRFVSQTAKGVKTYASPITMKAIVDRKQQQVRTGNGILSLSRATITFVDIKKLLTVTNNLGIRDSDIIILPDGTTGPILSLSGFLDRGTEVPVATEAFLG
jgi:hypothetical protein